MSSSSSTTPAIVYPETDDEPMAENTLQYQWIVTIKEGLESVFESRPDAFVAADLFWYPVEGDPDIRVAPDVMVAFGRPKGHRPSYMQWEEGGVPPEVVFEILSPGNRPAAMKEKLAFYERYGVREYYLYDPDRVELKGFTRPKDKLRPIARINGWSSPLLGVRFDLSGPELVIFAPNGERFLTFQENRLARIKTTAALEVTTAALEVTTVKLEVTTAELEVTTAKLDMTESKVNEIATDRERITREHLALLAYLRTTGVKLPAEFEGPTTAADQTSNEEG